METWKAMFKSANARPWLVAMALGLGAIGLYWPVTHCDFVANFDDDHYVTSNPPVQNGLTWACIGWAFRSQVGGNWHPLTMLSHALDCQLYGLNPWGHHLTNVLFHAANAILLFFLFHGATRAVGRSACVAALFACHPLHVESVAWVAERKDVLSTFFGFLALIAYRRYGAVRPLTAGEAKPHGHRPFYRSPFYWLTLICFALGLMSKPMLVTWPFVLLLLDYWPLDRFHGGCRPSLLIEKIPFLALAFAAGLVCILTQTRSGALMTFDTLPLGVRCENALISYGQYLIKLFWPVNLAAYYPIASHWPGWVLLAGMLVGGVSVLVWRTRRNYPFLLTGWFWFLVTLAPVIGLVQAGGQSIADRYTYIPSVGLLVMVIWGIGEMSNGWRHRAGILAVASSAALALCCAATERQITFWRDGETLFRHALQVTRDDGTANNFLGLALLEKHQTNAAISQFEIALADNPGCVVACEDLGNVQARQGQTVSAINTFRLGLRFTPHSADLHYLLGNLYAKEGQSDDAISEFQEAIHWQADFPDAHNNLASLLAGKGQTSEAISQFGEALRQKPDYLDAHYNLGNLFLRIGRVDDAVSQYESVIGLAPDFVPAHYYLGVAFARQGRANEAIRELQEVLRRKPDDAAAHNKLGALLGEQGRLDEAIGHFESALRLKPDFAEAKANLARALSIQNGTNSHAAP